MKKHISSILFLATLAFAACESSTSSHHEEAEAPDTSEEHLIVSTVEVEENPSDIHFENALNFFNSNQYKEASDEIQKGITAYRKETAKTAGKVKLMAEENIGNLNLLAQHVKEGTVKDAAELENTFEKSEKIVAHTIFYSMEDISLVPDSLSETQRYFDNALAHFKAVVHKEKSKARQSGEEIAAKGDEIAEKMKEKKTVAEKDIKDFYARAQKWLDERL